jgi:hypothetical protein
MKNFVFEVICIIAVLIVGSLAYLLLGCLATFRERGWNRD